MDIEDAVDHLLGDGRERNDLSQTSEEFRTEVALHHLEKLVVRRHDALAEGLEDVVATDVRREDNQRVREITHAAQTVMQFTFIENLQEQVEHRLVCLLNLIEQYD